MQSDQKFDDNYFIKNAILCWLHHYPNHRWTPIYEELSLRDKYVADEEVALPEVKKRPAQRKVQGRSKPTTTES